MELNKINTFLQSNSLIPSFVSHLLKHLDGPLLAVSLYVLICDYLLGPTKAAWVQIHAQSPDEFMTALISYKPRLFKQGWLFLCASELARKIITFHHTVVLYIICTQPCIPLSAHCSWITPTHRCKTIEDSSYEIIEQELWNDANFTLLILCWNNYGVCSAVISEPVSLWQNVTKPDNSPTHKKKRNLQCM